MRKLVLAANNVPFKVLIKEIAFVLEKAGLTCKVSRGNAAAIELGYTIMGLIKK